MAVARGAFLAAVLLLVSPGLHGSSPLPDCPQPCTCRKGPLLNCSSSGISLLPRHIQDSVTDLDLSHNLLASVTLDRPRRNLRNVWLGNNSITSLSLCIERDLEGRYVRSRRLHRLRPWSRRRCVSWAPTLQLLSVERNQLEQLPEGLEGSESLQVLQLSFNRISNLQSGDLSRLRQLKELHLQHNLITSLHPQTFQNLSQLQVLDLRFNKLTSLHALVYPSLRDFGADVRLDGNMWQCDCSMRSLRRWMAYDSSRGLQAWNLVCATPSILSGRDLLQLEEEDLNCFNTENVPEFYRDVTVYSGSEIMLTCSSQDSMWLMPGGRAYVSQPQAGLFIKDATERDAGLYVCLSEEHKVVSIFNLQISKEEGTKRKPRSVPRIGQQIFPQDTPNQIGQGRNERTTQSNLALAVCLSVFITFLIAFILGVVARPFIDVLWRRITNKKSSTVTNSSVEERQYENAAFSNGEEREAVSVHRERRVTFSDEDRRETSNVQYYDTVVSGDQQSINSDSVFECESTEKDAHMAGDSGSENSLRQGSPVENQKDGRDLSAVTNVGCTHNIEHIPDPAELEKRRSLSSCSDSSLSSKGCHEDQMTRRGHTIPESPQLEEDSVQQIADIWTNIKMEVPQISVEGSEIPGFSSEPFADWSPHTKNPTLTDPDLFQENEEQFEFSDSFRSTSARSSSICGSFNDLKPIVTSTFHDQKRDGMSSSSSSLSDDEPIEYTVNSGHEEEEEEEDDGDDTIKRSNSRPEVTNAFLKQDASFQHHILGVDSIQPSVEFNQGHSRYETQQKPSSMDIVGPPFQESETFDKKATSAATDSSSSSNSEDETTVHVEQQRPGKVGFAGLPLQESQTERLDNSWPVIDLEQTTSVKRRLDIKAPSPATDSSSSSDSEDGATAGQTESLDKRWPVLDLERTTSVKRRLDIKAPSAATDSSSSSDSEDETTGYKEQQRPGKVDIPRLPFQEPQTESLDKRWPVLDLEHTTSVKRRLDIKAPSPTTDSSSSSDSEDGATGPLKKLEKTDNYMEKSPIKVSQTASDDPQTIWPVLDLEHTTRIKRRLDIKAPSAATDSSSSSDSEDETTSTMEQQRPGKVDIPGLPLREPQTESLDKRWPVLDLEHTTSVKRRLDIKAPSPETDSSSSSDSEDGATGPLKKLEKTDNYMEKSPIKVSQTASDDPQTIWPVLDLEHTTRIKRRLDIKAPSAATDSSSSSDSEDETTCYIEQQRPGKVDIPRLPFQEPQTESLDKRWPVLDLERTTSVKRRLDIKAPSPTTDSSSSSDSEEGETGPLKKLEKTDNYMEKPPIKVSQTASDAPQTIWPVLDLEHTTRIKRHLDIKAPSAATDSSSSSDSEDETAGHIEQHRPGKVDIPGLPFQEPQTESLDKRWPVLDLERTTSVKRRLDIKAPSPTTVSSSSSDSEDGATGPLKKLEKTDNYMEKSPIKVSQTASDDPQTIWPVLDLERTTRIKRRLDIKAPSAATDSSSSSDSEDETTCYIEQQRPGKVDIPRLPFQEPQTESLDKRWPVLDLERTTSVKRRLDIKAPSPTTDSSSSSDSEEGETGPLKKLEKTDNYMEKSPIKVSQTASDDPQTIWPVLDLEHTTRIKRHLDIKAPSAATDSSSSSDSEDETAGHIEQHRPGKVDIPGLPFQEPQTESLDKRWPVLDLERTTSVKRRLDIKAPSPTTVSSSSSDSEDGATGPLKKLEKTDNYMEKSPIKVSQTASDDPQTIWPVLDLEHTTRIKRRLDIKAPSAATDSSSSSDSEDETTGHIEQQRPGKVDIPGLPFQEPQTDKRWPVLDLEHTTSVKRRLDIKAPSPTTDSSSSSDSEDGAMGPLKKLEKTDNYMEKSQIKVSQTASDAPQTIWPVLDLEHTTCIKRRLDIKAPLAADSSSSSDSEDETSDVAEGQRKQAIKISPCYSTSSSDEQAEDMKHLSKAPTTPEPDPDSKWPQLGPSNALKVKRRLDITARSSTPVSSSSNNERDKGDVAITDYDLQTHLTKLSLNVPYVTKRLDIKAPSPQPDPVLGSVSPGFQKSGSSSSGSDSENEDREHALGASAISKSKEMEFIRSPRMIHNSRSPKTDHSINLEKYTAIIDHGEDTTTNDNVNTTPIINPELESRWATMSLGVSRFRKRLTITSHTQESPNVPSSPSPDSPSPSPSSSDKGTRSKGSRARQKRSGDGMQGVIHRTNPDYGRANERRYLDVNDSATPPLQRLPDSSSSSESNSPSSCSEHENEVTGNTAIQSRYASDVSAMADYDSLITYKRTIFTPSPPLSPSFTPRSSTGDHTNQSHTRAEIVEIAPESLSHCDRNTGRLPSMSFENVVKRTIAKSNHPNDVDLPSKIRWTGIRHQLLDDSSSSPRTYQGVGLSTQQSPHLAPLHSSKYSSRRSDENVKEEKGETNLTLVHTFSSPTEVEGQRERKGLGALKAMSSERRRFEEDVQLVARQPSPSHVSSTFVDDSSATDLLYDIPRYRSHNVGHTGPPRVAPPPIPATPLPPDEEVGLTWRSPLRREKQGVVGTRGYLQQSRDTESDPSSGSQNFYFESPNISHV